MYKHTQVAQELILFHGTTRRRAKQLPELPPPELQLSEFHLPELQLSELQPPELQPPAREKSFHSKKFPNTKPGPPETNSPKNKECVKRGRVDSTYGRCGVVGTREEPGEFE